MPLIALDILEARIKELLIMVNHLNDENTQLKERLKPQQISGVQPSVAGSGAGPEMFAELENLKKAVIKYKSERSQAYSRLAGALRQIDELTNKG
jgi:hypothetical protein